MKEYKVIYNELVDDISSTVKAKGYYQEGGFFVFEVGSGRDGVVCEINRLYVLSVTQVSGDDNE